LVIVNLGLALVGVYFITQSEGGGDQPQEEAEE